MNIVIKNKLFNNSELFQLTLTPEQYFEKLDDNESYINDGIPKFNKAKDYIVEFDSTIQLEEIEQTIIEVRNTIDNEYQIKTTYLGRGQSEVTHREDNDGYELIITSIKIATNCIEITRMDRVNKSSEWRISSTIGLNYEKEHLGQEIWYSATKGEFINQVINENK